MSEGRESFYNEMERVEKEIVHLGLPRRDEINAQIDGIRESRTFAYPHNSVVISERVGVDMDENSYKEYLREFQEDIAMFRLRIERLKTLILQYALQGTGNNPSIPKDIGYTERKRHPQRKTIEQFYAVASTVQYQDNPITVEQATEVLKLSNMLIGDQKISIPPEAITIQDIWMLYEVVFSAEHKQALDPERAIQVDQLLAQVNRIEDVLHDVQEQGELFARDEQGYIGEEKFRKVWKQYRRILKQFATFEEQDQWFSPTYRSAREPERGDEQRSSKFTTDYQRFRMPEAESLERSILRDYYGFDSKKISRGNIHGYICNSGMNALQLILDATHRSNVGRTGEDYESGQRIVQPKEMYFEVKNVLNKFSVEHQYRQEHIDASDTEAFITGIKTLPLPSLVLIEPRANSYNMDSVDVIAVLESLCDKQWIQEVEQQESYPDDQAMKIVIDNSLLGNTAAWLSFDFSQLPDFVQIVGFESLVKYAQDGQDITQGGFVFSFGESSFNDLDTIRSGAGFMPPESIVRRIQTVLRCNAGEKPMERRSRNTRLFGEHLKINRYVLNKSGTKSLIQDIIYSGSRDEWGSDDISHIQTDTGGLLTIGFDLQKICNYRSTHQSIPSDDGYDIKKIRDKTIIPLFVEIVMQLAEREGVPLNMGNSYGFHTTRFAVCERVLAESDVPDVRGDKKYLLEMPYLRVSVGTENRKDITLIAELFAQANFVISEAMEKKQLDLVYDKVVRNKAYLEDA